MARLPVWATSDSMIRLVRMWEPVATRYGYVLLAYGISRPAARSLDASYNNIFTYPHQHIIMGYVPRTFEPISMSRKVLKKFVVLVGLPSVGFA